MNLVSLEYLAAHTSKPGVLILSNFAGSAHYLGGCLEIDPWDLQAVARTILKAIQMERPVADHRLKQSLQFVYDHTSLKWGKTFIETLGACTSKYNSANNVHVAMEGFEYGIESKNRLDGYRTIILTSKNFPRDYNLNFNCENCEVANMGSIIVCPNGKLYTLDYVNETGLNYIENTLFWIKFVPVISEIFPNCTIHHTCKYLWELCKENTIMYGRILYRDDFKNILT